MLLLTACGNGEVVVAENDPPATAGPVNDTTKTTAPVPGKEQPANNQLVTWVDRINIRDAAKTSAKVVARVPSGELMTFTGKASATKDAILLRGAVYEEAWLQVTTKGGVTGWVFGGAVKHPNEEKGNQVISATQLDFPYFGRYDLDKWEALDNTSESGGDAESNTKRYQKGAQVLAITETDMGEYGYSYTYQLSDVEKRVLLERTLSFQADMDMLLSETVINRIENPAVEYSRSMKLPKHPIQLNGRPMLVNGEWSKKQL